MVHYLGDGSGPATTEEELRRRANPAHPGYPNGYEYPEYDFGILADGTVITMRPLTVIGGHTQADKPPYNGYGENWWNKNAASVVLGHGTQEDPLPEAMVQGLIRFIVQFCQLQGSSMDYVYPHFQVTKTDCPAAHYSKIGVSTGWLDFDYIEAEVTRRLEGGQTEMKIVYFFGPDDMGPARRVAEKTGSLMAPRSMYGKFPGNEEIILGGESVAGATNLTGQSWEETTQNVINFLKG